MMYEDSTVYGERASPFRPTGCAAPRRDFFLELNDEKKLNSSRADLLTTKDIGMLELTSPELERIILDPMNDRFLSSGRTTGFQNNSFRPQQQQQQQQQRGQAGHGVIARDQPHESQRSFDSSMDQGHHQLNLPAPALDALVSSDEDSDTETGNNTYTTLVPQRSKTTETGFANNFYFNADTKPVTLHPMMNSTLPSVTTGDYNTTSRTGTHFTTATKPGGSYLPFGVLHSVPTRPKEEPMQLVPCMDGSPNPSLPPMSPINMDDQERVKQERKRERNRMAARKCRTKKLEQIMLLEGRVKDLKEQNRSLGDTAAALRALMHRLQSQISQHISCGCPIMMTTTTTTMTGIRDSSSSSSSSRLSFDAQ